VTTRSAVRAGTWLAAPRDGLVGIETLAQDAGIHPELARRLMALGLIAPMGGTTASPLFAWDDAAMLARASRLRRDLGLNYSGAVLACELLARIDELEKRLAQRHDEVMAWTRIAGR
jgi:chaperone modulatory protein CbpM